MSWMGRPAELAPGRAGLQKNGEGIGY
jgi:hypothetical protein